MEFEPTKIHRTPISVSPHSRAAVRLRPLFVDDTGNETRESSASGFFWKTENQFLLVTNWHVVTGTNPETREWLSDWVPNALEINFFVEKKAPEILDGEHYFMSACSAQITWDCNATEEAWTFHPSGPSTDLAAISLHWTADDWSPVCLNLTPLEGRFDGDVGEEVFVVGYPEGQAFERQLPLWKRGSIATDPNLDQRGTKQFFIDTIGNSGLSGSPVLLKKEVSLIGDANGRTRKKYAFGGVYAGRVGHAGLESQIGRVFKASAVEELIETMEAALQQ